MSDLSEEELSVNTDIKRQCGGYICNSRHVMFRKRCVERRLLTHGRSTAAVVLTCLRDPR